MRYLIVANSLRIKQALGWSQLDKASSMESGEAWNPA
jgi:hypothetical protein